MRTLVLLHNGKPMLASLTAPALHKRILDWPEDDATLFRVWQVPTEDSHMMGVDITEQFAKTWAIEFDFGGGVEFVDYAAPFPAFIRETVPEHLAAKWQARMRSVVPEPERRIA